MGDFTVTLNIGAWIDWLIHIRVNIWMLVIVTTLNDLLLKPMWFTLRDIWERYR